MTPEQRERIYVFAVLGFIVLAVWVLLIVLFGGMLTSDVD